MTERDERQKKALFYVGDAPDTQTMYARSAAMVILSEDTQLVGNVAVLVLVWFCFPVGLMLWAIGGAAVYWAETINQGIEQ